MIKCRDIRALFNDQLVRITSQNNIEPIVNIVVVSTY